MDTLEQEQFKHVGFFGIFKKSYKTIFSWWKRIFFRINLTFIFPLTLLLLANLYLSTHLGMKIAGHHIDLDDTWSDDPRYDILKHKLVREWILFVALNILNFLVVLLCFSLFTIAAVTITVACIYSAKEITLKKVMNVVPKAWKRLVITFLWYFFVMLFYNAIAVGLLVLAIVLGNRNSVAAITLAVVVVILYIVGVVYINVIWNMASVVSVLEDTRGLRAIKKSRALVKGKWLLNIALFVVFRLCTVGIQIGLVFQVGGSISPAVIHAVIGIGAFLAIFKLTLLGLVVQTILYLVCKSYHNESVDKAFLDDQLDGYVGKYGHLGGKGGDVQAV